VLAIDMPLCLKSTLAVASLERYES